MIQTTLETYLKKKQSERANRTSSNKFKPSSLGFCYRRQLWDRIGFTPSNPPDLSTMKIFEVGNIFHAYLQGLFGKSLSEVEINSDMFHGFADLVINNYIYDIKTIGTFASKHIKQKKGESDKDWIDRIVSDKMPNILQVMLYCSMLGKSIGSIVYVIKDSMEIVQFDFDYEDFKCILEEECSQLSIHWGRYQQDCNYLPEAKPRAYKGKECSYCSYFDKCRELEGSF